MKRVYKNRLSEFIFHDAWVSFISYDDNKRNLKLSLREFTVKDKIKGNVHIDRGIMLFEGLTISELCYPGCDSIYKDGKLISVNEPKRFATDKEYEFITNLKGSVQILDVEEEENGYFFSFDIINGGFFNCTLSFESVSIEVASDVIFKEVDDAKLDEIEEIYGFKFPLSLRKFYSDGIPYTKNDPNRFPRWWDTSPENVEEIKQRMRKPLDMLEHDIRENGFWIEEYWGKRPEGEALTDKILLLRLLSPPLIPIYCHRYMAVIDKDDSPVISVSGQDTIYYGKDFQGYLDHEFTGAPSEAPDKEIPLWSGVIEHLNTSDEHFEFLRKRHFENFGYYVSYNYNFTDVDKTLRILNALNVSEHKLLYGVNYYQNTGLTNDHLSEIEDAYQIYARDSMAFGDNENIKNIPRILGEVIKKDTDGEKTVKSQKETREYIDSLGSKKAFKYKYLIALLLRTFDQRKRIRDPRSELLTHDKIRFCGEKDISFATHYEVCGKYDPRNLYIWFEIDMDDARLLLCDSFFEAVITDDLENFENHLYTLSMVEYNNFNLVIGGNDLAMKGLVYGELAEICCDEDQFAKYTPERKRFM